MVRLKVMLGAVAACGLLAVSARAAVPPMPPVMVEQNQQAVFDKWQAYGAHRDVPRPKTAAEQRLEAELLSTRAKMHAAVEARDAKEIGKYFAEDYTLTLGAGLIDERNHRVEWLASGRPDAETLPAVHYSVRIIDANNAVMTTLMPYTQGGGATGDPIRYGILRGIFVFTKSRPLPDYKGWRLLASQMLRAPVEPVESFDNTVAPAPSAQKH